MLIPKLEKGVSAMLVQIHEALDQGIREILRLQSSSFEKTQLPVLDKMKQSLDTISGQFKQTLTASVMDSYMSPTSAFHASLANTLVTEVKKALAATNGVALEPGMSRRWSQQSILSPVESRELELKDEIDRDLKNGQYEKAFTSALGSTDLSIVLVRVLCLVFLVDFLAYLSKGGSQGCLCG